MSDSEPARQIKDAIRSHLAALGPPTLCLILTNLGLRNCGSDYCNLPAAAAVTRRYAIALIVKT